MANNLSSNQQYLLSLVQQNNPEILSKFLNEAKEDALGAYRMMKDKIVDDNGKVTYKDPEQQAAYDKAEARRNAPSSKYTGKVTPGMGYIPGENVIIDGDAVPSTQNKVALRYAKKAKENELPLEKRPISPFYKTTRSEFSSNLGRDFDASGGANPENMRTLVNVKTNLAGRLHDAERDWRDKISYEEQMKAAEKAGGNPLAMMMATLNAKREAEKKHKVHNYRMSDLDVPPRLQPGEIRYDPRTISTEPEVDTSSETEWFGADLFKALGGTPDMLDDNKQASNLSGKSVNQKINRIA